MLFLHHSRNICFVLVFLTKKKQQRRFNFRELQLAVRTDTLYVQADIHRLAGLTLRKEGDICA